MAKIGYYEALELQKQATPLAKEVYRLNADFKKYVAAFYLREHCIAKLRYKASEIGRLTEGQIDRLFSRTTGYWNTKGEHYTTPFDDESYVLLYYIQRAYLAMSILYKKVLASPQGETYKKLISIENQIIEFNNSVYGYRVESDAAAFVGSPLSDYKTTIPTLLKEVELIKEPNTSHYMFVVRENSTARELAKYFYIDINDFCAWNKIKNPDVVLPAGFVYFAGPIK